MSHFTTIKTKLFDREILRKALSNLGQTFQENASIPRHHGGTESVDFAVRMDTHSPLGFKKSPETGCYEIRGSAELLPCWKFNTFLKHLFQEYAYQKVLQETRKRGFSLVQEEKLKTGALKLVLRKVG